MKKTAILVTLLLVGVFFLPSPASATTTREWTFLVYMDGDNTLSYYTTEDLAEMRAVGSGPDINILVLVDYVDAGASIRYVKSSGDDVFLPPVAGIALEPNMADSNTLVKFVAYGVENYPAHRYAVILWNHGAGWIGFNVDDSSRDITTLPGLKSALSSITNSMGRRLDLVGFDECLMQETSVAYSIKNYADVMVASQANEVANGWYYTGPLNQLTLSPSMNASVLGKWIVDYYDSTAGSSERTLSVVNTTHLEKLVHEVNSLSRDLGHRGGTYHDEIMNSISYTEKYYAMADVIGYDLYHWTQNLDAYVTWAPIQSRTIQVRSLINQSVYYEKHGTGVPNSHGISIYLSTRMSAYNALYETVYFSQEGEHDDFLWDYVRYVDGTTYTPAEPTMQSSGTDLYINNTSSVPSGYGSMFKFPRGSWIESGITTYSTAQSGTFYARTWNGVDYSDVNSSTFSGITRVIVEAGSGGYTLSFHRGWNLMSLPTATSTQASRFVNEVEYGVEVVRRTSTGNYEEYVGGEQPLGVDFDMVQTSGYYFYADLTTSHLVGGVPTSDVYDLSEGWNLVGYSGSDISADSFCLLFTGYNTVVHRTESGYEVYDEQLAIGSFTIEKGMGFYLWAEEEVVTV